MRNNRPDFQNFKRYKKNKDVTAQNILTVFTTTFLIMLIFFIGAAKQMTSNIDVTIGEDSATDAKESGLGVKGFIDNRLKAIQSEDNSSIEKKIVKIESKLQQKFEEDDENEYYSKDLEEKVKIPEIKKVQQATNKEENPEVPITKPAPKIERPEIKQEKQIDSPVTVYAPTVRVVVGNYASIEQAKAAQKILQESNLGLAPFIKQVQGSYTLQVGSFSSEEKAQGLANELVKNDFPARVLKN